MAAKTPMKANLSKSELRTLKTQAAAASETAKSVMEGIALIRDNLPRGSASYKVAQQCYEVAKTNYDGQEAKLRKYQEMNREVGYYGKGKKAKAGDQPVDAGTGTHGLQMGN